MRINNNLAALNAWRNLSISGDNMQKSLQRLSSGYRINKAADDAAGLAVSEKMKAQIRGLNMALRNTQDGISLLQTAEGGAAKIQDMLQRMRELAVQASSGSLEDADRAQLQLEFEELTKEINRTAKTTTFNNQELINGTMAVQGQNQESGVTVAGSASGALATAIANGHNIEVQWVLDDKDSTKANVMLVDKTDSKVLGSKQVDIQNGSPDKVTATLTFDDITVTITNVTAPTNTTAKLADVAQDTSKSGPAASYTIQVGANQGERIEFRLEVLNAMSLGLTTTTSSVTFDPVNAADSDKVFSIYNRNAAATAIDILDSALEKVTAARAQMGAYQNRLESTVSTLQTQAENLTAAESRIRDVDMAQEMAEFTRYQVLQQAGVAMLAQANQLPQGILSLLR